MAVVGLLSSVIAPDCDICRSEAGTVVSTLIDPLVMSVSTLVCPSCYGINYRASVALVAASPRLVLKEHAA